METESKNNDLSRRIIECAQNHNRLGLDKDIVERLEKDYFELCEFQRYYSNTRWTITSFFIMLSFAGCGYILQAGNRPRWMTITCLIISLILYWIGIILFWRRDKLTHAIREYLETLGPLLGIYTYLHIKESMSKLSKTETKLFKNKKIIKTDNILIILGIIFIGIIIYAILRLPS